MSTYALPVSTLLKLGRQEGRAKHADYTSHGIGPDDIPELIRLLRDEELVWGDPESPEVYAQIHAWRALGELRAEAAIEPLLDLLAEQEDDEKQSDWVIGEVPAILGMIGPAAFPATVARLDQCELQKREPSFYACALKEIASRHPAMRAEAIAHIARILEDARVNHSSTNGFLLAELLDLRAVEAWPTIERAFATGNVDEMIAGGLADAKYELGLGPKPPRRSSLFGLPQLSPIGPNAKQRFNERMRKKKAEKKQRKKERKGR